MQIRSIGIGLGYLTPFREAGMNLKISALLSRNRGVTYQTMLAESPSMMRSAFCLERGVSLLPVGAETTSVAGVVGLRGAVDQIGTHRSPGLALRRCHRTKNPG